MLVVVQLDSRLGGRERLGGAERLADYDQQHRGRRRDQRRGVAAVDFARPSEGSPAGELPRMSI
jgi:hypothetical protein